MLSVRNGLLLIIMLISNHKSLAEQLVAADVTTILKKCLTLSRAESMLAIIALNHISMVHKLESKGALYIILIIHLNKKYHYNKSIMNSIEVNSICFLLSTFWILSVCVSE